MPHSSPVGQVAGLPAPLATMKHRHVDDTLPEQPVVVPPAAMVANDVSVGSRCSPATCPGAMPFDDVVGTSLALSADVIVAWKMSIVTATPTKLTVTRISPGNVVRFF